ncbi:MAG: metal ABC transporter substrate-binding protein [bacterium]|nr:metal ABC transporter substrate-binding protein [bacterium]
MKQLPWIILIIATLVLAGFFALRADTIAPEEEIDVATTIFPFYDITRNIVGDTLSVDYLLPAGASPHTYEPTPRDVHVLASAKALYTVHENFDGWAVPLGVTQGIDTIDLSTVVELIEFTDADRDENHEDDDDSEQTHEGDDPHYWLSFNNATMLTAAIRDDLAERFPEHAAIFMDNAARYIDELQRAKRQAELAMTGVENPHLITMHGAWAYFATDLNLEIVGSFEPEAGQSPTARDLEEVSELVKQYGITTIYTEPQLSEAAVASFANDTRLNIAILDPLGGLPGRETFIDLMLYNVNTVADTQ